MTCVAIIGSTEEGAVDPILGLYHLRQQFRMRVNYHSYVLDYFHVHSLIFFYFSYYS